MMNINDLKALLNKTGSADFIQGLQVDAYKAGLWKAIGIVKTFGNGMDLKQANIAMDLIEKECNRVKTYNDIT